MHPFIIQFENVMVGRLRLLILLIVACLSTIYVTAFFSYSRSIDEIPNPKLDPKGCGRKGPVQHSSICDPDELIKEERKDEIEGYINSLEAIEMAVVIIHKMSYTGLATGDPATAAMIFARGLHDKWGVGDKETNNGIVLFLSIFDRQVYISTGNGVKEKLNSSMIQSVITAMRPFLRKEDYATAVARSIIWINLIVNGKDPGIALQRAARTSESSGDHKPSSGSDSDEGWWDIVFTVTILAIFIGGAIYLQIRHQRRLQEYERGRSAIKNLMTAVDKSNPQSNKYFTSSCPICLEDYPQDKTETATTAVAETKVEEVVATAIESQSNENTSMSQETTSTTTDTHATTIDVFTTADSSAQDTQTTADQVAAPATSTTTSTFNAFEYGPKAPMALKCGHIFCRSCLESYLESGNHKNCPICRKSVSDESNNNNNSNTAASTTTTTHDDSFSQFRGFLRRRSTLRTMFGRPDYTRYYHQPSRLYFPRSSYYSSGSVTETIVQDRAPEIQFRLNRMSELYPNVVTAEALRTMHNSLNSNDWTGLHDQLNSRSAEVTRMITDIHNATRESAARSGHYGSSRSSFSGGRSSGGGGGSW